MWISLYTSFEISLFLSATIYDTTQNFSQFQQFGQKSSTLLVVRTTIVLPAIGEDKTLKMWKRYFISKLSNAVITINFLFLAKKCSDRIGFPKSDNSSMNMQIKVMTKLQIDYDDGHSLILVCESPAMWHSYSPKVDTSVCV